MKKNVVWFEEVDKEDVGIVGGKGANLGEMTQARLPIPYGFIVTSKAYFDFVKKNDLTSKFRQVLNKLNYNDQKALNEAATKVQKLIMDGQISTSLISEIVAYYDRLRHKEEQFLLESSGTGGTLKHTVKNIHSPPLVAVRSSATAEDLPYASFAGQQETFLNVRGETHLIYKIKECWASLFTPRAMFYRHTNGFDHFKVGLAAVVQRMVQSDKSGIAFSIDPVTNDKSKIVIEAIFGLGEYIVQGRVTPDHYEVVKGSFTIEKKEVKYQEKKYIKKDGGNVEVKLNKKEGSKPKLADLEILRVALLVKQIEDHYYFPQDIEWAIEKNRVYIVQSRPITTTKDKEGQKDTKTFTKMTQPILVGSPASPGIGVGPVTIVTSPTQINRVKKGDVMVAPQTDPDYVPAMRQAIAIVTEKGGRTSHAAIVSRELGIPAIVGAEKATHVLKNGMIVSVNGERGEIYKGSILAKSNIKNQISKIGEEHHKKLKTLTKVYVNLAEPDQAEKVAKMDVDGIGLLRAEFMIAQMGTHPKTFIKQGKQKQFVHAFTKHLEEFVKPFSPRPVVYRATDFKTNEYKNLKGGHEFEPHEENPMLGFRGAARYIANPDVFTMELEAISAIWEKGYKNLHLMIPFIRAPWELLKIKDIVSSSGLLERPGFKLWIMVEVPSSALALEEFIKLGIHGVSIGTNDLTMMLLGVDRDNEEVAHIYDERSPVVVGVLEHIVKVCVQYGITCSICGQAASDYPQIVDTLVRAGITSVSVTPDAVDRTRELIHDIERRIYKHR